jgi:hypothetical protein
MRQETGFVERCEEMCNQGRNVLILVQDKDCDRRSRISDKLTNMLGVIPEDPERVELDGNIHGGYVLGVDASDSIDYEDFYATDMGCVIVVSSGFDSRIQSLADYKCVTMSVYPSGGVFSISINRLDYDAVRDETSQKVVRKVKI